MKMMQLRVVQQGATINAYLPNILEVFSKVLFDHKNAKISGHTDNCLEICGAVQEGKAVEFQIEQKKG